MRSPRFILLAVGLAGLAALIFARGWYVHDLKFRFLVWNLFLALVPAFSVELEPGEQYSRVKSSWRCVNQHGKEVMTGEASGVSDSQPFGQAMPRFTG